MCSLCLLSLSLSLSAAATVTYDKDAETVCLEFGSELAIGELTLSLVYTGCLNDQMRGFYRSKYTVEGEERYAAVTQFEVRYFHTRNPHSWFIFHSSISHTPGCRCS